MIGKLGYLVGAVALNVGVMSIWLGVTFFVISDLYAVTSSSMEPTLHCPRGTPGDERCLGDGAYPQDVVVSPFPYWYRDPDRGEIAAFRVPAPAEAWCEDTRAGDIFIKRVVGLPGETVEERAGVIYVDGERLSEHYIHDERAVESSFPPTKVPAASYFMLGDDRVGSCDSRLFGFVPRRSVEGKVVMIW